MVWTTSQVIFISNLPFWEYANLPRWPFHSNPRLAGGFPLCQPGSCPGLIQHEPEGISCREKKGYVIFIQHRKYNRHDVHHGSLTKDSANKLPCTTVLIETWINWGRKTEERKNKDMHVGMWYLISDQADGSCCMDEWVICGQSTLTRSHVAYCLVDSQTKTRL